MFYVSNYISNRIYFIMIHNHYFSKEIYETFSSLLIPQVPQVFKFLFTYLCCISLHIFAVYRFAM